MLKIENCNDKHSAGYFKCSIKLHINTYTNGSNTVTNGGNSMAGSTFGTIFRITTWGESHGTALGVVVDGCPAGISLSEDDVNVYMERRRPNGGNMSTAKGKRQVLRSP